MTVVKKSFVKGFTAKVLDKDREPAASALRRPRASRGRASTKRRRDRWRMLIPLHGRVGRKRFKAQIAELMRGGNAYFIKNAEGEHRPDGREHQRNTTGHWRASSAATARPRASSVEARRGHPIAVLVPGAALKRPMSSAWSPGRIPRLSAGHREAVPAGGLRWRTNFVPRRAGRGRRGAQRAITSAERSLGELRPPPRPPARRPPPDGRGQGRDERLRRSGRQGQDAVAGLPVHQLGGGQGCRRSSRSPTPGT